MPLRHRHKRGDWLVTDDESGIVNYRSEMVERWDGLWVRRDQYETRQPQEFVKAKTDPRAVSPIRPENTVALPSNNLPNRIGVTDVLTPRGPAAHLFDTSFRIGPPGIASTAAVGTGGVRPSGFVVFDLSGAGIASTATVTQSTDRNRSQISIGTDLGVGDMEIRVSFEVR